MRAVKDGIDIHFNSDKISDFMGCGYDIYDDDYNLLQNPEEYAQQELEKNTHTATMPDFLKWLEENGYSVTKAN